MGTLKITLTDDIAKQNVNYVWSVSPEDVQSLLEFLQQRYAAVLSPGPGNKEAAALPPPDAAWKAWCEEWINSTIAHQNSYAVSQTKIPPIVFTPVEGD